jgi:alkylhydroperoxidase/carboxymuconolactone decarboxylase family protein YurZ
MTETTDTPILDLIASMTADSIEAADLDAETLMLVRIAALVAVDAPPASYLMNLGAAGEVGLDEAEVRGVLAAVAPIVGTATRCLCGDQHRARARGRRRARGASRG